MYERAHTHMMANNILIRFSNETDKKAPADLDSEKTFSADLRNQAKINLEMLG